MRLIQALRYRQPACIAFVGAGGKSTALFRAAKEIVHATGDEGEPQTVLVTTSTHLGVWQAEQADHFYRVTSTQELEKIGHELQGGVVLISGEVKKNLLEGLPFILLDKMHELAQERNLPLLIEADGAHTCPLKAPANHEPAIPDFVEHVVVVAGLSGLGKSLSDEFVHRPERFASISGMQVGDTITAAAVVKVLKDDQGGLKNIPMNARRCVLLNQADTPGLQSQAKRMSDDLISVYDTCVIASLKNEAEDSSFIRHENSEHGNAIHAVVTPIAGIVLAAGGSSRFGEPKQLLRWKGQPFIRHVALSALKAGLKPVIVVVGCNATEVQSAINDLPVRIVNNDGWMNGMSTSIRKSLAELPMNTGAAIFLQSDQPHIPVTLIKSLVEAHQLTLHPIIAPLVDGQRGNPVLFDQCTFSKLQSLVGDIGGRALFGIYPVDWINWHDPKILIDIDSPADYAKFLQLYPETGEQA